MANQLGKCTPNLSTLSQPLRELMSTKKSQCWGPLQQQAFEQVKRELTRPTILALYNPNTQTKVSADALSQGLRAVLFQETNDAWKPVAYPFHSLSATEI